MPMRDIPRISVILPNFNHEKFVGAALRALLSQSPAPAEIIVIDDASTDDSLTVIRAIAATSPSVRVVENATNLGTIRSQQRGLALASGDYVYFAAADDWVMPGFFALALEMLDRYPQAGLFCGDTILVEGESDRCRGYRPVVKPFYRAGAAQAQEARAMLRRFDNWMLTGSTILRREAIDRAGGLDETCDTFADGFLLRKIALADGFCYAPRLVAAWRIFAGGASRRTALDLVKATAILRAIPAKIASDPAFPPWYARLFCRRWRFAVARLAAESRPINYRVLDAMAGGSSLDVGALRLIRALFAPVAALERTATLAWLALRLRPYPLSGLLATRLSRWRMASA
jgi:glycosyltransferase involved in cell wall biosynthesis